jgi:hypothetical protein
MPKSPKMALRYVATKGVTEKFALHVAPSAETRYHPGSSALTPKREKSNVAWCMAPMFG